MNNQTTPRGKFISFEGGEGVGKSTQVMLLRDHLTAEGYEVVVTREPGGTTGAEEIRQLLLSGDTDKWLPMTEVLLFYAARVDHIERVIKPALEAGKWVISDRYADSSFAYQGAGHGLTQDTLKELHHIATRDFWPDLTLVLDADVDHGLSRATEREAAVAANNREDRFENMAHDFHQRLRQAFLDIAAANPVRCRVISATGSISDVAPRIWQAVQNFDKGRQGE